MAFSLETKLTMSLVAICTSWIPIIGWVYALFVLFIAIKTMGVSETEEGYALSKKILLRAFIAIILIPISFMLYGVLGMLGLPLYGMTP